MFSTVGEVKEVASKVWPAAAEITVHLVAATADAPQGYRACALGEHNRLLGRVTAASLNQLKDQLEQELAQRNAPRPASAANAPPSVAS